MSAQRSRSCAGAAPVESKRSADDSFEPPRRGAAPRPSPPPTTMATPFQWSLAALETLMAEDQMDQHAAVLRAFSVVELWRLRRVCRAFHRWAPLASTRATRPLR